MPLENIPKYAFTIEVFEPRDEFPEGLEQEECIIRRGDWVMERKGKKKVETVDIYKDEQREEMLKNEEITAAESAFIAGRKLKMSKTKRNLWLEKKETKSIELAQEEYQED
jgi:hypothetical protein